jgi:hypothetical protein
MAARKTGENRPAFPVVRVAPLKELKVYEISETELSEFESGPPGQLALSFALAMLPAALTILITLQTVEIQENRTYYGYWVAFWNLSVLGLYFLAKWWISGGSLKRLGQAIRARMPEQPGIPEQDSPGQADPVNLS